MPTTLNRKAYEQLIDGDLAWLRKQPGSLESEHIEAVLQCSADQLYGTRMAAAEAALELGDE